MPEGRPRTALVAVVVALSVFGMLAFQVLVR
jgi:hypothetical protein